MAKRRMQRRYTLQERQDAVRLAREVGNSEASRRLDIPTGTVSCWRFLAGQAESKGEIWPTPGSSESSSPKLPSPAPAPVPAAAPAPAAMEAPPASTNLGDQTATASADIEGEAPSVAEQVPSHQEPTRRSKTARRVARRYTPSQRAAALEQASREGVSEAARKLGISRWALNDWRRKAERAAKGEGESPTSGPDPAAVEQKRDQEILTEWREHPGLGPSQIRNQLRRKGVKVCTNTVRRVMEDAGYRPGRRLPSAEGAQPRA